MSRVFTDNRETLRGAEKERAAIVAWLRALDASGECVPPSFAADAIERLDHLAPRPGEGGEGVP